MKSEERPIKKVERIVYFFKKHWGGWVFGLIGISVTLLFAASLVFDKDIQLQIINNWIGIILGLVATIASIISLFLSFYNLEQERDEAKENRGLIQELRNLLQDVGKMQRDIDQKVEQQMKETASLRKDISLANKPEMVKDKNVNDDISGNLESLNESINILLGVENNDEQ